MQVIYLGRGARESGVVPSIEGDGIELLDNNWNDYGYETFFHTACRINGDVVDLGSIRLLIEDQANSRAYLAGLLANGWDGIFPFPERNYISVPSEITFYEQLSGQLGADVATQIAETLRDASLLVARGDERAEALVATPGFDKSLQRERGNIKAFVDGWKILENQNIAVLDLGFRFNDVFGNISTLRLKFQSESPLPHDINVLIGPNGSGKSQLLHQMVKDWTSPTREETVGFVSKPNLSQLVVLSYSPFENFPVDLASRSVQDDGAYRYFGFRGRSKPNDSDKLGTIRISQEFPRRNAAEAMISCLRDDQRFRAIKGWAQKVKTVEAVLQTAIDFDFAAVQISPEPSPGAFYTDPFPDAPAVIDIHSADDLKRYIPIPSGRDRQLSPQTISEHMHADAGVAFFRDGQPIELSSGQRLFAYLVINIVGAIRRNSLILVDEPELFLHPTLEIQFIEMLKKILAQFNSKALLATHSVVTVREVPADCVHVFERTDDGLVVKHPPFQTFGGDVQRISSYVFGDSAVSKPFEAWIQAKIEELGSGNALIAALGKEINEELIIQIKAMDRGQW